MNTIVNDSEVYDGNSGDVAVVGESSRSTAVSLQTLQSIYNELTGKTEQVGKSYNKSFQVEFSDLEQLNLKIIQSCEQYNIVAMNVSASVFYLDDTRDQFSSFERFKLHNAGTSSQVESVLLRYNILIVLPKTKATQAYTISVRVASRTAISKKMAREFHGAIPAIFKLMGNRVAVVEIEYVDYMLARNFLNIIDGWFGGLKVAKPIPFLDWLQARSHQFPGYFAFFATIISASLLIFALPNLISETSDLERFVYLAGLGFLIVYTVNFISRQGGIFAENALDRYSELSYLKLTKGDERAIEDAKNENKSSLLRTGFALLVPILTSVIAKVLSIYLFG
jgi:hypothetical protein